MAKILISFPALNYISMSHALAHIPTIKLQGYCYVLQKKGNEDATIIHYYPNGVFDEVWEIGNNRNDCIYRRLAWDIRSQLLLSLVISILCLLPLCKKLYDIVNN